MNASINIDKVMQLGDLSDLMSKSVQMLHAIYNDQPKTVILDLAAELLNELQSIIGETSIREEQ